MVIEGTVVSLHHTDEPVQHVALEGTQHGPLGDFAVPETPDIIGDIHEVGGESEEVRCRVIR